MAMVSAQIGWRASYMAVTAITAALAVASALLVRDAPAGHAFHARSRESLSTAWRGVREVLAVRELWPLLVLASTAYAVVACIIGLWGGPFLFDMYGLDATARGSVIIWFPAGMILGNFTITPLDRILDTRKLIIVWFALATVVVLLAIAFEPRMPLVALATAFGLIGVLSAYTSVIIAHGRCFYPDRLMGDEIPKLARLLHVADAFEAMTAARPYRMTPLTSEQALGELRKFAGIQFDPEVVDAFVRTKWAENVHDPGRHPGPRPIPLLAQHAARAAQPAYDGPAPGSPASDPA